MKTAVFLGYKRRLRHQESDNLFGWSVFILLLCGFALTCWIGTFYIFTHPEQPFNYQILSKLKKLDPPRRFQLTAAPSGEFLSPEKLRAKFGAMNFGQLTDQSNSLLRSYIRNYDHEISKIPYVTGKFIVIDSFPLSATTFLGSGVVVLAHSLDVPSVYLEHFYPAGPDRVSALRQVLKTGLGIELRRSFDLSAVIHITSLGEGRLLFSCVPLLYGPYGVSDSGAGFLLEPPKAVNLKAGLPVVKENALNDAEKRFTVYTRASGHPEIAAAPSKLKANLISSELSAAAPYLLKTEPAENSGQGLKPALNGSPASIAKTNTAPRAVLIVSSSSPGTPKITSIAATSPSPNPVRVPLQPFLTASPPPSVTARSVGWQIYRAGQMPRGRLLDVAQTAELADKGVLNQTMYLHGDFTVTAAKDNRAVLRPHQSLTDRVLNRGNARVIVEFPEAAGPPRQGETFQRASDRPFQIVDVRRGSDGQVNIYAREITSE